MKINAAQCFEVTPDNIKTLAKRVLKDNNMQLRRKFTPVVSEYKMQVNPNRRFNLRITEDEFSAIEECKKDGNWKKISEEYYSGLRENVEENLLMFINYIKSLCK